MEIETYLYPYSANEARKRGELALWRASHQANISCKRAIEESIRQNFDGMRLNNGCVDEVIAKYGYKRTAWVLSNTIQQKDQDGRFSQANKQWAKRTCIPSDHWHNSDFVVESHPAVLDGFVTQYCKAYQALGLFGPEHCHPDSFSSLDYEGKVLVLSPDILKESYWNEGAMLWYAHDGFGCGPHAIGRSIRCTCLGDGEMTRWNRADFIGVLKDEFLPDWAAEKLAEFSELSLPDYLDSGQIKDLAFITRKLGAASQTGVPFVRVVSAFMELIIGICRSDFRICLRFDSWENVDRMSKDILKLLKNKLGESLILICSDQ